MRLQILALVYGLFTSFSLAEPPLVTPSSHALPSQATASAPEIILAADGWCPYNCIPDSDHPGYVIELAREIFAAAGYRLAYRRVPWARALQSVGTGEVTAAIGATDAELPNAVFPDEPIGQFYGHFILPRESVWRYQGGASLDAVRLGVINSYDYGPFNTAIAARRDAGQLLVLSGEDAINRGLGMLVRGRLDAFVEDRDVARYTARQLGLEAQIQVGDPVGEPIPLFLAFSAHHPQAPELARLWSAGIRAMRGNGRLAEILAVYGVDDWQSP